jgi:anti-anti-sigma factor
VNNVVPISVKQFPEPCDKRAAKFFLREIREFVNGTLRPRVIVNLSEVDQISPEGIDLLLKCVGYTESNDGKLSLVGTSPRTAVMLELTQADSVLHVSHPVKEALDRPEFNSEEKYPEPNAA